MHSPKHCKKCKQHSQTLTLANLEVCIHLSAVKMEAGFTYISSPKNWKKISIYLHQHCKYKSTVKNEKFFTNISTYKHRSMH
jgi:hypothetical protein